MRKTVLVVEDNLLNRSLLCQILADEYAVLEAENGQEALALLGQYGEGISLILLDIVMPVMDGYTFLKIIKADPAYAAIPVIVTTQNDAESDEVAALSHGASDFVAKPYRPQIILHRVASIINLRETAAMVNLFQYDRLTGLYSKEFFYQQVKEALQRNPGREYDIICSNIENFKLVNDVFGIPTGDRLLAGIAGLYRQGMDGRGICGRMGADQFACLLERKYTYTEEAFQQASVDVNKLLDVRNIVMKWGIYPITDRSVPVEQMCDRALLAARSIKGQYGKYFARYDDALRDRLLKEQAITDSMEAALAEGQFQIYLQPKYRIRDERMVGAEALVRWDHPEWGFQSPAEFIPLFEKNGFITRLDQFVWDKACAAIRSWDDKGFPPVAVSVNVSRADIYNADLAGFLMGTVRRYGLSPFRLHLEITESAYTENPKQIIDTVRQLRELGFIIEMDDFGSGYSSLNMLNEMPIDILKLDMKFIQSETAKPNSQGILQFIINLARWMHLNVVAEGVETKEQLCRLAEIGCDYVQGYYFAKPMPVAEFEALLAAQADLRLDDLDEGLPPSAQEGPRLLVADEDAGYREEVRRAFRGRYEVDGVASCEEALQYIRTHPDTGAVILSLTLPAPDGFTVLGAVQADKSLWDLPVIATAPPDAELERRALGQGADDFICKPHFMQSLLKRTQAAIRAAGDRKKVRLLQDAAFEDPLTGVLNRRGLEESVSTLGENDLPLAVYAFDLDGLKNRNQDAGYLRGDQVLAWFGTVLRRHTREDDVLARVGGDEFLAVLRQMRSEEAAARKGEEICAAVREYAPGDGAPVSCTAGLAMMREGDTIQSVIQHADQALYQAKKRKKGSIILWGEETL
ncbi:EAL domain-containing protein [Intestinibacillus massiliensis]|uniref:EAL domain-containing protein n=1 Tax=Intestinibacillus massiliensis TaxID=1871029 RepID=UPI000B354389|nr:EAL domain-containing protein [Intestinibacillus massiliensis]